MSEHVKSRRMTNIHATEFGGAGDANKSAYGGMVDPHQPGVALPFRFKGARPRVRLYAGGQSVDCEIVDRGPWNIDDPYWQSEHGRPAAERQHYEKQKAWNGRVPSNIAGIDCTPAALNALGVSGKVGSRSVVLDWEFIEGATS